MLRSTRRSRGTGPRATVENGTSSFALSNARGGQAPALRENNFFLAQNRHFRLYYVMEVLPDMRIDKLKEEIGWLKVVFAISLALEDL